MVFNINKFNFSKKSKALNPLQSILAIGSGISGGGVSTVANAIGTGLNILTPKKYEKYTGNAVKDLGQKFAQETAYKPESTSYAVGKGIGKYGTAASLALASGAGLRSAVTSRAGTGLLGRGAAEVAASVPETTAFMSGAEGRLPTGGELALGAVVGGALPVAGAIGSKVLNKPIKAAKSLLAKATTKTPEAADAIAGVTPKIKEVSLPTFKQQIAGVTPKIKRRISGKPELVQEYFDVTTSAAVDDTKPSALSHGTTYVQKAYDIIEAKLEDSGSVIGKFRKKIQTIKAPVDDVQRGIDVFDSYLKDKGLIVKNGKLVSAPSREAIFNSKELTKLQEMRDMVTRLKGDPKIIRLIDVRNKIQKDIKFAKQTGEISTGLDPVATKVRAILKQINEKVIGKSESKTMAHYSDLKDFIDELNGLTSKGRNPEFLLKRVLSERDRLPKATIDAIKQETGIDLLDHAQMAQIATELLGDTQAQGLFRQEITKAGVDVMSLFGGGPVGKILGGIRLGEKFIDRPKAFIEAAREGVAKSKATPKIADTLSKLVKKSQLDKNSYVMNVNKKVYRGEGKGIGNSTLVNGQYFADSKEFASQFGNVSESVIPKGSKVFDLDKVKSGGGIIPDEMLVDQKALTKYLIDNGFDYTRNTNTRGVEFVKLNKTLNELETLASKSKSLADFKQKAMANYDTYQDEIARLSKNYTKADISRLRDPLEDIYRNIENKDAMLNKMVESQNSLSAEEFVKAQKPSTTKISYGEQNIPIKDLYAHGQPELTDAIRNVKNNALSRTTGIVEATQLPNGKIVVLDGQHRIIQAINGGENTIKVNIIPYDEAINPEFGYTVRNLIKDGTPVPFQTKSQLTDITDQQLIDSLSNTQKARFNAGTKAEQTRALEHLRLKSDLETKDAMLNKMSGKSKPLPNNKSVVSSSDMQNTLIQEAKKYKSAGEFVESLNLTKQSKPNTELSSIQRQISIKEFGKDGKILLAESESGVKTNKAAVSAWEKRITDGERPIVYVGGTFMRVVDGNNRLAAYKNLGFKEVPTVFESQLTDIFNKAHNK